jgi:hypothetical protein
MTMIVGGSLGVTFPIGSTTAPTYVTSQLGPGITDTSNVLTINGISSLDGTTGVTTNGIVYNYAIFTFNLTTTTNANLASAAAISLLVFNFFGLSKE